MEIIKDTIKENTVVALGNFDGLHRAHTEIINRTCAYAKKHGLLSCVLLFNTHTNAVTESKDTKLLTDEREKLHILRDLGVDLVYIQDFDSDFMHISPNGFIDFLKNKLNVCAVSVGYDYRFGYKAEGDADMLSELGKEYGIEVLVCNEIKCSNDTVKSTKIRELLEDGKIEYANDMLGRNYFIIGEVVKGLQNGRKLGIPTANIKYSPCKLLPKVGVYMGITTVDETAYISMVNIGNNPTFGADKITVESHILDFEGDIYGKTVKCELVKRIRDEKKFGSIDELKIRLEKDKLTVRERS